MKRFGVLTLFFVYSQFGFAQSYQNLGYAIVDIDKNKTIASKNINKLFTPASVVKLITTATAFEILGPDFRFMTEIAHDGRIKDSVLHGNIYIVGGGDPSLGSKYFDNNFLQQWCEALKTYGIQKIEGDIVADVSIYDRSPIPATWAAPDLGNYFAAGVYGLSYFDNSLSVEFLSKADGTRPQILSLYPNIKNVEIQNRLVAKNNVGDNAWFSGKPYSNNRKVTGSIEANSKSFVVKADIGNPEMVLLQAFEDTIKQNGIGFRGKLSIVDTKVRAETKTILKYFSPKLSEIIGVINIYSHNTFADHLLKYLSLQKNNRGSFADGIQVVRGFWKSKGLSISEQKFFDGSGLSKQNRLTVNFLSEMLNYIYRKSPNYQVFLQSLPIAGESGTVKSFLRNTSLSGMAYLKTGSMSVYPVQCYAGFVEKNGITYSVVVMANDFDGSRKKLNSFIEKLLIDALRQK